MKGALLVGRGIRRTAGLLLPWGPNSRAWMSVTVLALSLACAFAGRSSADSAAVGSGKSRAPYKGPGPFALIVVVDAARFDEFDLTKLPNLARLAAGGTQYLQAWVGELPSVTETSHATIGTGALPWRHQILGDTWRVPGTNQMAPNLLNGQLTRTGYIGKLMHQGGSPSLASFVQTRFPGSQVVAVSGHKIYAADALGAGAADFVAFGTKDARGHFVPAAIPGHAPAQSILTSPQLDLPSYPRTPGVEDTWTTTLALKFLFKYHPRLMMVNLPEVDTFGHAVGTDGTVMGPLMAEVDRQIGRLLAAYTRAGMISKTTFVVTSDHAMIPALHTVGLQVVDRVIQQAGGQALYVGHGDYCPIWVKDAASVPRVAAALSRANIPNVSAVYSRNPKGQYVLVSPVSRLADPAVHQSYADLLATINSPASPDIVLLYDENTITMTPSFQKINRKGDHGGATWGSQHIPLIMSGPGVKPGYRSVYPARLADIAPTLEALMGGRPSREDGVALADAMIHPPPWAVAAESKVSLRLSGDVAALVHEATVRPNSRRS